MIERVRVRRTFPAPIPVGDQHKLPCSGCSGRVDPLRAPRVAVYGDRFCYFCSPECRVRFVPGTAAPVASTARSSAPGSSTARAAVTAHEAPESEGERSLLDRPIRERAVNSGPDGSDDGVEGSTLLDTDPAPLGSSDADRGRSGASPESPTVPARSSWLTAALCLGVLAAALATALMSSLHLPRWAPASVAAAAFAALVFSEWTLAPAEGALLARGSDPFARVPPLVATLAAMAATAFGAAQAAESVRLAGIVCAVAAGSRIWITRKRRALGAFERWLALALGDQGPSSGAPLARPVSSLKPGEELVLRAGDRVQVDVVITAGEARVEPWPGSRLRLRRSEGDGLLAGTTVVEGALRAVVRWVGHDRGWARLGVDPTRRADRHLAVARLAERLATTGAIALALLVVVVSLSLGLPPMLALGYAAAVAATLANVALADLIAILVAQGVHRFALRGICLRSAAALDRAGRASSVVFCDRGTLLAGELSVASIEPSGGISEGELLGLLAGAYGGVASPIASALTRSLAAQKLRADATRSPNHLPGLGVTAVASNGQALVAGTRALLLDRRISVASAETRIGELEALGRSVLLVALDGRWVGLVALQDGLRSGARAATQTLLDAGVEPVLLSGEARETCRALARHIGIEHVRPEVLPHDRAAEIRRLSQAGGVLAVVGSSIDDAALAAAPLSIDIDARGGPLERCDIDIASGDVRDAAGAIQLARALHAQTRSALVTATTPSALGLLLLFVGLPPWLMPLLGFLGTVVAARRSSDPP
jgi:Cu+-exporting ATPase